MDERMTNKRLRKVLRTLAELRNEDLDEEYRTRLIDRLEIGDDRAIPELLKLVEKSGEQDVDKHYRSKLIEKLGEIGDKRTVSELLKIVENSGELSTVRGTARKALEEILDREMEFIDPLELKRISHVSDYRLEERFYNSFSEEWVDKADLSRLRSFAESILRWVNEGRPTVNGQVKEGLDGWYEFVCGGCSSTLFRVSYAGGHRNDPGRKALCQKCIVRNLFRSGRHNRQPGHVLSSCNVANEHAHFLRRHLS